MTAFPLVLSSLSVDRSLSFISFWSISTTSGPIFQSLLFSSLCLASLRGCFCFSSSSFHLVRALLQAHNTEDLLTASLSTPLVFNWIDRYGSVTDQWRSASGGSPRIRELQSTAWITRTWILQTMTSSFFAPTGSSSAGGFFLRSAKMMSGPKSLCGNKKLAFGVRCSPTAVSQFKKVSI